jgi:hypothetical protein
VSAAKRGDALLVGIAVGAAGAVIAFAAVRVLERALFPEPNPAMLIWADRSPLVWRAAIALYLGGAAAFGGHALAVRSPRAAARGLLATLAVAVAAVIAQGAVWP